ncbi:MbcA/ParS/Xre antitoxin family protein [Hephaestia mangrovi]|uniref:MbcA/ParS/Xre antitoxin family protein n=1 Tax=Hephaestia mangrovi TaxID=2873268 RepID=UPI001CA6E2C8|nr:MbcA/ParS/Xre antitoxin family protein [Hephaestia mangrovi]MBY8827245.1 MbcA/ParS/Xre antitoxin family protein [Hephaestia mangrovi]
MATAQPAKDEQHERALTTAVARIAACWKLSNEQLAAVLGVSPATASRLRAGRFQLERHSKAFELGQYLVRLFRGLDALMGSDDTASQSWLRTGNLDLDGRPIDLIRSVRGLGDVADYVDAYRAQV